MRILFLTDSLSDFDGVGRYTIRLIQALEELVPGLEVEVLLARKHRPTSDEVPARWDVSVALPPDYFFYMSPVRFFVSLWLSMWRVRRAAKRADLVHAIKDYPHNFVGYLGARLAGKPCVATAHGTYTVQPILSKRHSRYARWLYPRFAHMISVSRYTKKRVLALMGDSFGEDHITVIPNKVSAAHYADAREVGDKPWHHVPFTLGIGEVKERKGHHLALAGWCPIAREQPELHHYIVGKSTEDDPYRVSLEELAREAGAGDRVHFLGNITEDEKIDLLQRAQVFIHTPVTASDGGFEGFGIVYLEASASRTPCIGTLDCGAEDAIEDGATGFLVEQNAGAVEEGLKKLLDPQTGEALRAEMGDKGVQRARKTTWRENAESVLAIYHKALGRSESPVNPLRLLKSKFLKDTATLQMGSFISSAGNLFSTILLAYILGAREQGNYFVAISLYSLFFLLLSTGINQATVSQAAAAHARGNHTKVAIWLAFQLKAYIVLGGLFFGAGYFFLPAFAELEVGGGDRRIGELAWWLAATPLIEAPRAVAIGLFQSTRRMMPLTQTENAHEMVRVFLVMIGAVLTGKAEGAIAGMLLASLLGSILAMELYRRARAEGTGDIPSIREILSHVRDVPLRRGLPLGMRIGLLRSIDALGLQVLPMLIINALVGSEVVAYTRTAQRIMNLPLMMLMGGISRSVFPVLTQLAGLKDMAKFKKVFLKTTLVGGSLISIGILTALPFVHLVVAQFWPPEYIEPVSRLCLIFAVGCIALSFAIGLDSFYIVTNSMNGAIWLNIIGLIVTAGTNAYLCSRLPETGGAWGITFAMSWGILHYFYVAWVLKKRGDEPPPDAAESIVEGAQA